MLDSIRSSAAAAATLPGGLQAPPPGVPLERNRAVEPGVLAGAAARRSSLFFFGLTAAAALSNSRRVAGSPGRRVAGSPGRSSCARA